MAFVGCVGIKFNTKREVRPCQEVREPPLLLITVRDSVCTPCEGLQGETMGAHSNDPLNQKRKKNCKKENQVIMFRNRCLHGNVLFVCFKFHLFPLLIVEICDWNSTQLGPMDRGIRRHLIGKPGVGGFLIWSLAWREVYCSTGCCSPGQVNC